MMKQYMYIGTVLAAIVLAGCTVKEEMTEDLIDTPVVELPPLEPLKPEEIEALYEPKQEVEKLTYEQILIENPDIANLKTYEQVEEYYNLKPADITEVPEGVFPLELNSIEEFIENFEAIKRYQEKNQYEHTVDMNDNKQVEQIKAILNNIEWENAKVEMLTSPDYKFKLNANNEVIVYDLWISSTKDKIELIIPFDSKYAEVDEKTSAELFEMLTGNKLADT